MRARALKLAAERARRGTNVAGKISSRVRGRRRAISTGTTRPFRAAVQGQGREEKEKKRPPTARPGSRPNSTTRARGYSTALGGFLAGPSRAARIRPTGAAGRRPRIRPRGRPSAFRRWRRSYCPSLGRKCHLVETRRVIFSRDEARARRTATTGKIGRQRSRVRADRSAAVRSA